MSALKMTATSEDAALIEKIAIRAIALSAANGIKRDLLSTEMDVTACHLNSVKLRLAALLAADDFNLAHDVFGIERHLDRDTGQLGGCFLPRFSVRDEVDA